jgi:hypothetical protein
VTDYSSVYPEFIESELKTERERRANLESRGGSVVTQSGTLSTLLIAAAAFVRGNQTAHLPNYAVIMVVISTLFFLGAGVLGILMTFPYLYKGQPVADEATMEKMLTVRRADPDADARTVVATVHKGTLSSMRTGNRRKALFLSWAQICQIAGLVALLNGVLAAIVR